MNSPAPRPEEVAALSAEVTIIKATYFTKNEAQEMEQRLLAAIEPMALESDMNAGFTAVRAEMNAGFTAVRSEMNAGFAALRSEMQEGFAVLRTEMTERFARAQAATDAKFEQFEARIDAKFKAFESRMVKWMLATLLTVVGTLGAMFYSTVQLILK